MKGEPQGDRDGSADPPGPTIPETFAKAVDFLQRENVPFAVVGGLAAGLRGEPRGTQDVDLMVALSSSNVPKLAASARAEGFEIEPEHAETQWRFSGFVRLWLGPRRDQVAVDLMACNSEFLREAMWRAQPTRLFRREVPIASAEDVLLFKLSSWRTKDIPDAQSIVSRHGNGLDSEYLRKWATWFSSRHDGFRDVPARLEAVLRGEQLPPANLE